MTKGLCNLKPPPLSNRRFTWPKPPSWLRVPAVRPFGVVFKVDKSFITGNLPSLNPQECPFIRPCIGVITVITMFTWMPMLENVPKIFSPKWWWGMAIYHGTILIFIPGNFIEISMHSLVRGKNSLKLTASLHMKMRVWKTILPFLLGFGRFLRGIVRLLVFCSVWLVGR